MVEPVRYFLHDEFLVAEDTKNTLQQMAGAEGVLKPVVVLPDIHYKYSYNTPTGVVVMTKDTIIPKFLNANCGMAFALTPFLSSELDDARIDGIFNFLKEHIAVTTRTKPVIAMSDLDNIIRYGAGWAIEKFKLDANDSINFENEGSLLKDDPRGIDELKKSIPSFISNVGLLSIGVLGYGNHFVELQEVEEIMDKETANKFGISRGQLCFMLHTDSRAFGQALIDYYSKQSRKLFGLQQLYKKIHYRAVASERTPRAVKTALNSLNQGLNRFKSVAYWKADKIAKKEQVVFKAIQPQSDEGVAYLTSTYAANNFGYANRAYMVAVIRDGLKKVFKKESVAVRILHDGNHDCLQVERFKGEDYYAHRNGASRAWPAAYFPKHPVFSKTGQPVLLPSALGRQSFLCAALNGCEGTYYSSCHGTGRLIDRGEARGAFKAEDVLNEVKSKKVRVYDYGEGYISEEAPEAFKDILKVLSTVEKFGIARPVARLKPIADLKGWR